MQFLKGWTDHQAGYSNRQAEYQNTFRFQLCDTSRDKLAVSAWLLAANFGSWALMDDETVGV